MAKVKKSKAAKNVAEKTEAVKVVSGQLQKKIQKQKQPKPERGVVFLKHLPHGFYEEQMKKYFEQFGEVTRLRLARSKTTGRSKGFAFVEFEFPEVAEIAAETMNNYLMFQKIVKASYIPPEKQKFNYFKTKLRKVKTRSGKEIYVSGKTVRIARKAKEYNTVTEEKHQERVKRSLDKVSKLQEKYGDLGIDFNALVAKPTETSSSQKEDTKTAKGKKDSKKETLENILDTSFPDEDSDNDDNESVSSNEKSYGFSASDDESNISQEGVILLKSKKPLKQANKLDKKPKEVVKKTIKKQVKSKVTNSSKGNLQKKIVTETVGKRDVISIKKGGLKSNNKKKLRS